MSLQEMMNEFGDAIITMQSALHKMIDEQHYYDILIQGDEAHQILKLDKYLQWDTVKILLYYFDLSTNYPSVHKAALDSINGYLNEAFQTLSKSEQTLVTLNIRRDSSLLASRVYWIQKGETWDEKKFITPFLDEYKEYHEMENRLTLELYTHNENRPEHKGLGKMGFWTLDQDGNIEELFLI